MDNIRIPITFTDCNQTYLIITPAIARQIVEMSQVPAFEANTLSRLESLEKWVCLLNEYRERQMTNTCNLSLLPEGGCINWETA